MIVMMIVIVTNVITIYSIDSDDAVGKVVMVNYDCNDDCDCDKCDHDIQY